MTARFEGKRVIVTGGASGFGEAMVRGFAAEGAQVMVADIDGEGAERVAADVPAARAFTVDVTDPDQTAALVDAAVGAWGGVDVFCANAGATHRRGSLLQLPIDEFDRMFTLNVRSVYLAAKYSVPHMTAGGSIIATGSVGALRPRPGFVAYGAAKGAVITLVKGLATELAPVIRVNAVLPVSAPTKFDRGAYGLDAIPDGAEEEIIRGIPMRRRAQPRDVSNSALFLASDEACFLTGVCLQVDGGRSI